MKALTKALLAASALCAIGALPAIAQVATPGLPLAPRGYCQMTSLSSAKAITAANCVGASFTATASGANLTVTSVTGYIVPGQGLAGTGVPAGTSILNQQSGTTGGAGVYTTSAVTTASSASLTTGGIPVDANTAIITAGTQAVRFRDDGGTPTASVGQPLATGAPILYSGPFQNLSFIEQTSSAKIDITFYKSP